MGWATGIDNAAHQSHCHEAPSIHSPRHEGPSEADFISWTAPLTLVDPRVKPIARKQFSASEMNCRCMDRRQSDSPAPAPRVQNALRAKRVADGRNPTRILGSAPTRRAPARSPRPRLARPRNRGEMAGYRGISGPRAGEIRSGSVDLGSQKPGMNAICRIYKPYFQLNAQIGRNYRFIVLFAAPGRQAN